MFSILNKDGAEVPMRLNPVQADIDSRVGPRNIIIKPRQKGVSSYFLARYAVDCLTIPGTRAVVISHESEATKRLFDKVHFYLRKIKGPKPVLDRESRTELFFPKTESTFYIGTAGSKTLGRGDTVTRLHLSEYGWWESDALKHIAGLWQAVPKSGIISIESTGNGRHNDLYRIFKNRDYLKYNLLFYPWFFDPEYQDRPPEGWSLDQRNVQTDHLVYLKTVQTANDLTNDQMYWYTLKLAEHRDNIAMVQQEYPATPLEAFQATGGAVFKNIIHSKSPSWVDRVEEGVLYYYLQGHPFPGYHYSLGADPSGGTGNDDAAITIFCAETSEQVLEWRDNRTNPIDFTYKIAKFAKRFNDALVVPEANNHGAAVIPLLKTVYSREKIWKRSAPLSPKLLYGWMNTRESKNALVGLMQELLYEGLTIYGNNTYEELCTFEEIAEGKMEGASDNLVIATGLAGIGLRQLDQYRFAHTIPLAKAPIPEDYKFELTYEMVMASLPKKQAQGLPFERQVPASDIT